MGDVSDMTEVAEHLHSTHPSSTIVAVGVSMGRWELKKKDFYLMVYSRCFNLLLQVGTLWEAYCTCIHLGGVGGKTFSIGPPAIACVGTLCLYFPYSSQLIRYVAECKRQGRPCRISAILVFSVVWDLVEADKVRVTHIRPASYTSKGYTCIYIRESVDSLCRDGVGMPMPPYI